MSTLTLEEEQLARQLKAQGKSTQDILGAIANQRLQGKQAQYQAQGAAPAAPIQTKSPLLSRVLADAPSDYFEMGANVKQSLTEGFQGAFNPPEGTLAQKGTAGLYSVARGVSRAAGDVLMGAAKLGTTNEFEQQVAGGVQQAGQSVIGATNPLTGNTVGQDASTLWQNVPDSMKGNIQNIIAPGAEFFMDAGTAGAGGVAARTTRKTVQEALKRGAEDVAAGVPLKPSIPPGIMPPETVSAVRDTFTRAVKPNLSSMKNPMQVEKYNSAVTNSVNSIVDRKDSLTFIDEATGETVTGRLPQDLKEFVDAIEQTKAKIFESYDDIATKAGDLGAQVDTIRIANELDSIINSKSLKLSNPEAIAYAEGVRERLLRTKTLTSVDAQDVIKNYNNSLQAFYRNPTPEGLTRNAVDALVANQLRVNLDEAIDGLTGAQYQALKNEYASLKTVERDVMRAFLRDARKNTKGLIDFTDVLTGGQVVSGILSFNPAAVAQGLAGKVIAEGIKMINDPNRAIKKIFESADRFSRPKSGPTVPNRKQLPAADPNAPRSEVGSGRPMQTGGQTPGGRVEPGLTERTAPGAVKQPGGTPTPTLTAQAIKSLQAAGVKPEDVQKAITAGLGGYLLLAYTDEDGSMLPAGLAILAAMPNAARKTAIQQALAAGKKLKLPENIKDETLRVLMRTTTQTPLDKTGMVDVEDFAELQRFKALAEKPRGLTDQEYVQARAILEKYEQVTPWTGTKSSKPSKAANTSISNAPKDKAEGSKPSTAMSGGGKGATAKLADSTPSLLEVAKKYKSAEEFVKVQPKIYHGTPETFDVFDTNVTGDGAIWFTESVEEIRANKTGGVSKAGQKLNEMERVLKPETKLATPDIEEKANGSDDLIAQGYRGVVYPAGEYGDYTHTKLYFPNEDTLSRTQLEDIWKQANRP